MHLRSFLSQVFLLASYGLSALAAQTAAQVKAGLTELVADITPCEKLCGERMQVTQDKIDALTSKFNTFATAAAGSTGFASTDAQAIAYQYNQLALELSFAGTGLLQKACLFSTTPAVGAGFANSANALLGGYSSYSNSVRTIDPVISSNTFVIYYATFTLLQAVKKAYEGALCGV
ncbi:hypothetical protein V8F33_004639 [Rhypophila sp. PSN 637]